MTRKKYFTAVCGIKNSGKTTLLEGIIRTLDSRGLRVAVIKHDGHDFECDIPGTDSFRLAKAGAYGVSVYSKSRFFIAKKRGIPGEEKEPATEEEPEFLRSLADIFCEADVLLIEGCKEYPFRKIEVVRSAVSKKPVSNPEGRYLIVSDLPEEETGVRTLPFEELDKIVDAILETGAVNSFFDEKDSDFARQSRNVDAGDCKQAEETLRVSVRDCCGVLLRGGKSRRMGMDKALLMWDGNTFLKTVAEQMDIFTEKYLSVASVPEIADAGPELFTEDGNETGVSVPEQALAGSEAPASDKGSCPEKLNIPGEYGKAASDSARSARTAGSQALDGLSEEWRIIPDKIPDCGPLGGIWTALSACRAEWALAASCDIPAVRRSFFLKLLDSRSEDVDIVCPVTPDGRMHMTCALYRRTAAPLMEKQLREGNYRMRGLLSSCRVKTIPVMDPEEVKMLSNINTAEELRKIRGERD